MILSNRWIGTVHGKTIVLQDNAGLSDGEEVAITIEPLHPKSPTTEEAREALRRAAGAWADDDLQGLDEYLEWNRQQRKLGRSELAE